MASSHSRQHHQSQEAQEELHTELPYHSSLQPKQQNEEEEEQQHHQQQQEEVNWQKENEIWVSAGEEEGKEGEEKQQIARLEGIPSLKESNLQKEKETRLSTGGEEDEKKQQEACLDQSSTHIERQAEDSPQHLQSQKGRLRPASSGNSTKDLEALPSPAIATTTNADLLASPNCNGSIFSLSCNQVEGVLQSCLTTAERRATKLLQQAMDTVQSQVLCALHQAASDIIEHLGKDAARRVAVAEQKAALLEQELSSVKQQALSMLLRLKANSNAQVLEAEKKYLVERRRAQDAEAKLVTAQDTSKRLKLELRKKGDILDKMQKLVQPVNGDYQHKPSRLSEATDYRGNNNRSKDNDMYMKSLENRMLFKTENASLACNGIPLQEVQGSSLQPNTVAVGQAADNDLEKRWSRLGTETAAAEDPLEVRWRTSSSAGTVQDSHYTPGPHKGDVVPEEMDEQERLLLHDGGGINTDHGGLVEESCQVALLASNLERDDRQGEQTNNAQLLPNTERLEESILSDKRSLDDKDVGTVKASNASIKGFYVRRRAREKRNYLEKEGKNILSSMQDFDLKIGSGETLSSQVESKVQADMLEGKQILDSEDGIDVTGLKCLSGHVMQSRDPLALEPGKNGKGEFLGEEARGDDHGKDSELATSTLKDQGLGTSAEFARPDYEVATSLAELAVFGSQQGEPSPSTTRKEDIFIKPGKTGLRMKRKGVSFKKKAGSGLEGKASKKPRLDKGDTGLLESNTGRVLRRTRADKSTTSKDDLAVESSRDSRRLMQGARQLLCLAEKKWR